MGISVAARPASQGSFVSCPLRCLSAAMEVMWRTPLQPIRSSRSKYCPSASAPLWPGLCWLCMPSPKRDLFLWRSRTRGLWWCSVMSRRHSRGRWPVRRRSTMLSGIRSSSICRTMSHSPWCQMPVVASAASSSSPTQGAYLEAQAPSILASSSRPCWTKLWHRSRLLAVWKTSCMEMYTCFLVSRRDATLGNLMRCEGVLVRSSVARIHVNAMAPVWICGITSAAIVIVHTGAGSVNLVRFKWYLVGLSLLLLLSLLWRKRKREEWWGGGGDFR